MKKRTLALLMVAVFTVSMLAGIGAAGLITKITAELRQDFTIRVDGEKPYQNFFASDKTVAFSRVAKILLGKDLSDKDVLVTDVSKI